MIWLEEFTIKYPQFYDEEWLYESEKLSAKDKGNIDKFNLFYNGIQTYAQNNFIYPKKTQYGDCYFIQFNGIGYKIGKILGLGRTIITCNRTTITKKEIFLDFKDILQNKKLPKVDFINERLQTLSSIIHKMIEEDIPLEAISQTTKKTLQKIRKKSNNHK